MPQQAGHAIFNVPRWRGVGGGRVNVAVMFIAVTGRAGCRVTPRGNSPDFAPAEDMGTFPLHAGNAGGISPYKMDPRFRQNDIIAGFIQFCKGLNPAGCCCNYLMHWKSCLTRF